jgi:hypothetical protein
MNNNIYARLISTYSKKANSFADMTMEPMEPADTGNPGMLDFANQAMGMRTPDSASFSNPDAIKQRMKARSSRPGSSDLRNLLIYSGVTKNVPDLNSLYSSYVNDSTDLPQLNDEDNLRALRSHLAESTMGMFDADGPIAHNNRVDDAMAKGVADNDAATTMGVVDLSAQKRKAMADSAMSMFDADGPIAHNNRVDDAMAKDVADNDAATTMGVVDVAARNRNAKNEAYTSKYTALRKELLKQREIAMALGLKDEALAEIEKGLQTLDADQAKEVGNEAVDAFKARSMGDEAVDRFRESPRGRFLKFLNPTGDQTTDYGIYGGGGALLGGLLGSLFSSKENRLRNALLFALLGGGLGVGGKYLADKHMAG